MFITFDLISDELDILIFVNFMTNGSIFIIFILIESSWTCSFNGHQLSFEFYLGLRINRENSNGCIKINTRFIRNKKNCLSYSLEILHVNWIECFRPMCEEKLEEKTELASISPNVFRRNVFVFFFKLLQFMQTKFIRISRDCTNLKTDISHFIYRLKTNLI